MALKDEIIDEVADVFDELREDVMPGVRFFLLKREGQTKRLAEIVEITSGGWVRWNEIREQMQFVIADNSEIIKDFVAQTTFTGYGVPNTDDEVDVFVISDDQRDRIAPTATSPFWKLFGTREPSERFTL